MKIIFVALLLSAGLAAQSGQVIYTGPSAIAGFLTANPQATVTKVEQAGVTVNDGKQHTFIAGPGLTYQDGNQWKVTQPQIQALPGNTGWLQTGSPVRVEIAQTGATSHLKVTSASAVFDLDVTGVVYSSANEFTFVTGGQTWRVRLLPRGAELEATVAKRQGAKTYSFAANPSVAATVDKDGNITVGSDLTMSHAGMIGANHQAYPCTGWTVNGGNISFSCDDSKLPDAAIPYVIDPVTTADPSSISCTGVASDDGTTCHIYGNAAFTANFTVSILPAGSKVLSGSLTTSYSDSGGCSVIQGVTGPWQGSRQLGFVPWTSIPAGQTAIGYSLNTSDNPDCEATIGNDPQVTITYAVPPTASFSIPPNPVTGTWTTLTVTIQDADGWGDIMGLSQQVIVNTGLTYAGGCAFSLVDMSGLYDMDALASLLNDSGGTIGTITLARYGGSGSGGPYTSNGCSTQWSGGYVNVNTLNLPVNFTVGGNLTVYANLTNTYGINTGWITLGTIYVTKYTVATPTFSPTPGTYTSAQTVTISTTTPGATIRYTTDGSTPSETHGTAGAGPVQVSSTNTVKAIAYLTGWYDSAVANGTYTITGTVGTPTISPAAGTYNTPQTVTISTGTPGATIRFTTDGSAPSETHGTVYSGGFSLSGNVNVKAIAYEAGWNDSTVSSATYSIYAGTVTAPTFSPPGGTYTTAQTVTLSSGTPGATIRYTINGSTPTETNGTVYGGPFTVSTTTSISAVAYETGWLDSGISAATYSYGQVTPPSSGGGVNLGTPPADSGNGLDPRRTGARALGAYWGAAGEQIDTDSGNLNFAIPLVNPQGRGGWGVTLRLSYNSQMWRQDTAGTWLMGQDVGYGLGWRLQAGSLIPIWSGSSTIDHYLFTDSTGAEYSLDVDNGGVWTSREGVYIAYDSNANRIYNPDGSFWVMGCTSAGGEQDTGTLYPTLMEDTNGNQVQIQYATGAGSSSLNTSGRIMLIGDPRRVNPNSPVYTFTYNSDAIPHLVQVSAGFVSPESYTLTYLENQPLNSPFSGASYGTTTLLAGITVIGMNITHTFQYGGASGEMTTYTTPLGGALGWQYRTFTYNGGISLREVQYRTMSAVSGGGTTDTWDFAHPDSYDSSLTYHSWTDIHDQGAGTDKVYWPGVVIAATNLVGPIKYEERDTSGTALLDKSFGWITDAAGNAYANGVTTTLNGGGANAVATSTAQTLDTYGNLIQQQVYDYGANSPTRTYNFTYLTDSNYVSRYIRNRLTLATVSTSTVSNFSLVSNVYDNGSLQDPGTADLHDSNYNTSFTYRGNPTSKWQLGSATSYSYQTTGVVYQATVNGVTVTTSPSSSTAYSLPGVITPNGNSNLATTVSYASSWAVTSVAGPNGATATTNYDGFGRPLSSTSSDGAVTNFTYAYSAGANTQTATNSTTNQWKKTTLDGFGRVISVQTGHDSTTISEVDTQYAPCACSPLGKMWRVSLPYAPGQSPVWTTYTYDGSGRTLTVTAGDGSVTSNVYAGNNTTETDPAGKWKTFTSDAFGNLTIVTEPDPASQSGGTVLTYYTYNAVSQLTQVSMTRNGQPQMRTFTWSGTDLASATNPENGTVSYQYDTAHHVTLRIDAKGQQTQYTYDSYGRLTQTRHYASQYSNGIQILTQTDQIDYQYDSPISSFSSNTWGRLAAVAWGAPGYTTPTMWYEYNYNQAGRVTGQRMGIPIRVDSVLMAPEELDATYTWDNQGRMTSTGIPLGPTYQYQYDAMSNLSGMTQQNCQGYNDDGSCGSYSYPTVASAQYNWAGMRTTLSYLAFNETRSYNNLLQLTRLQNNNLDTEYIYQAAHNNGRIAQSIDHVLGETVNYSYDSLNRLVSAEEVSGKWANAFSYDGWGNINGQTWTPGQAAAPGTMSRGPSDANGNLIGWTGYAYNPVYQYDVENRMVWEAQNASGGTINGAPVVNLGYDPWGKRVSQSSSGDGNGGSVSMYAFYGIDGKRLARYQFVINDDGTYAFTPQGTNLYFGGAMIQSNGVAVATDRLGSVRANGSGEKFAYYPYGMERKLPPGNTITPDGREKFGTYIRDGEFGVGQDYADQRYYDSNNGWFWSPDPGGIRTADPQDPTSWNRYAYAGDDPINFSDPEGLYRCADCEPIKEPSEGYCDVYPNDPLCSPLPGPVASGPPQRPLPHKKPKPPYYQRYPCDSNDTTNARMLNFMDANSAAAQQIGQDLGIAASWVLAVAAEETLWGTQGIVLNSNNFFGLHVNGPGDDSHYANQTGVYTTSGSPPAYVATFSSQSGFLDSGMGFASVEGQYITGAAQTNWSGFAAAIHANGYGVGNSSYMGELNGVYSNILARIPCTKDQ